LRYKHNQTNNWQTERQTDRRTHGRTNGIGISSSAVWRLALKCT